MYSKLSIYRDIDQGDVKLNVWWYVCDIVPKAKVYSITMLRMLVGCHELNVYKRNKVCQLCSYGEVEDIDHLFWKCDGLKCTRVKLWE